MSSPTDDIPRLDWPPDVAALDPASLPGADTSHRILGLDGAQLLAGLQPVLEALSAAVGALTDGALRLEDARAVAVDWTCRRKTLRFDVDPATAWAVTASASDGPRVLWRLSGTLVVAVLEAMGSDVAGLRARALLELEQSLLDAVWLEAIDLADDDRIRTLVATSNALHAPLRALRSRDALVHLSLWVTCAGASDRVPARLDLVLPRSAVSIWARSPDTVRDPGSWPRLVAHVAPVMEWHAVLGTVSLTHGRARELRPGAVCLPAPRPDWRADEAGIRLSSWLRGSTRALAGPPHTTRTTNPWLAIEVTVPTDPNGTLALALDARRAPLERPRHGETLPMSTSTTTQDAGSRLEQALAETPVELRLELGRLQLTAAQLTRLHAGDVLDSALEANRGVGLWLGERRIGTGELVELDGHIGVRVTEIATGIATEIDAPTSS